MKRLIEVVRDSGATLSVVLAGHLRLKNGLERPAMEEIGSRATIFELDGICQEKPRYRCTGKSAMSRRIRPVT